MGPYLVILLSFVTYSESYMKYMTNTLYLQPQINESQPTRGDGVGSGTPTIQNLHSQPNSLDNKDPNKPNIYQNQLSESDLVNILRNVIQAPEKPSTYYDVNPGPETPSTYHNVNPGSVTPSTYHNVNPGSVTPSTYHNVNPGSVTPSTYHNVNPGSVTPSTYHNVNPGSVTPSSYHNVTHGPETPSTYHNVNPGPETPSTYHNVNPGPEIPSTYHNVNPGPETPSTYHNVNPGPETPSTYHNVNLGSDTPSTYHNVNLGSDTPSTYHNVNPGSVTPSTYHNVNLGPETPSTYLLNLGSQHDGKPLHYGRSPDSYSQPNSGNYNKQQTSFPRVATTSLKPKDCMLLPWPGKLTSFYHVIDESLEVPCAPGTVFSQSHCVCIHGPLGMVLNLDQPIYHYDQEIDQATCFLKTVSGRPTEYLNTQIDRVMSCSPGTVFSQDLCTCTHSDEDGIYELSEANYDLDFEDNWLQNAYPALPVGWVWTIKLQNETVHAILPIATCFLKTVSGRPTEYLNTQIDRVMSCSPGTIFSQELCTCTHRDEDGLYELSEATCYLKTVSGRPTEYLNTQIDRVMSCSLGTIFSQELCTCTHRDEDGIYELSEECKANYDLDFEENWLQNANPALSVGGGWTIKLQNGTGLFNSKSAINFWYYQGRPFDKVFSVQMEFKDLPSNTKRQSLLTNCGTKLDQDQPSLLIELNKNYKNDCHLRIIVVTGSKGQKYEMTLPVRSGEYNMLSLEYNRGYISAFIGYESGETVSKQLTCAGDVEPSIFDLRLGSCDNNDNGFVGLIDWFKLYPCIHH